MSKHTAPLSSILRLRKEFITIDDTQTYQRVRVQLHQRGIVERDQIAGSAIKTKKQQVVRSGDVLVAEIDAKVGGFGVAPAEVDGAIVSSHYFLFEIDTDVADPFFVGHLMRWPDLARQVRAQGSTNYAAIRAVDFLSYQVPVPPIDEQSRVAARLDLLHRSMREDVTPRSTAGEARLEALAVAGLQDMANNLRQRGHQSLALGDIGRWSSGGTPSAKNPAFYDGGIPWAVIGDLNDGVVHRTTRTLTTDGLANSSAKLVPAGTVLIAMYGSIGKLGLAGIEMATNQAIACCVPNVDLVSAEFLMLFLRCIRLELVDLGQGGAQQNISQNLLKAVPIPVPPAAVQQQFVEGVTSVLSSCSEIRSATSRRRDLSSAFMPAVLNEAFAGLS